MANPSTRPLMSSSTSELNIKSGTTSSTKKRKRPEQDAVEQNESVFTAQAVASDQTPKSCVFTSLTVISRSNLPLAWLNPLPAQSQPPPGYTFKSDSSLLAECELNVLIARHSPNGGLYAIENAGSGTYTAWPLAACVSEELCHNARQASVATPDVENLAHHHGKHSRTASASTEVSVQIHTPRSTKQATNRRGAFARMSILTPRDIARPSPPTEGLPSLYPSVDVPRNVDGTFTPEVPQDPTETLTDNIPTLDVTASADPQPSPAVEHSIVEATASTSSRVLQLDADKLLEQYLETLYISKTSLAFWAKGPLSRARAQSRTPDASFGLEALRESYLSMVHPTKKMDLKYKESVSNKIKALLTTDQDIAEANKVSKKRTPKKTKLGKDCLYTGEDITIANWWRSRELKQGIAASSGLPENDLTKAISDLRNRETEMQLLLILEVLYIDKLLLKAAETSAASPGPEIKEEAAEDVAAVLYSKSGRNKKQRDLNAELDANAERLSIWHTVAIEDILSSPEKTREANQSSTNSSKDKLRDFCRDVIIPFYSAKVPEQAKSICRKLGGPEVSPQRPRSNSSRSMARSSSSFGIKAKPQSVLKRSLQRVLSEDQTARHASPPVLSRSATVSHVPKLKREPSESEIRPISRSSMQKSVSFSNREIDLVADAKAHNTKKRKLDKLATQKMQLEEAINALKRPNRTNAAKSLMDEIEGRNIDMKTGARRPEDQVHITATPRRAKSRSSSGPVSEHLQYQMPSMSVADPASVVPSSTFKQPNTQSTLNIPASSKKKRAVLSAIHDTPSRGMSRLTNPLAVIEATPAANRLRHDLPIDTPQPSRLTTNSGKPVLFTPIKRTDVDVNNVFLFRDVPEIPEMAGKAMDRVMGGKGMEASFEGEVSFNNVRVGASVAKRDLDESVNAVKEKSIYEQLGWDDHDDI